MTTTAEHPEQRIAREDQERWARKGRETLESLPLPTALKDAARASLDTPQFGPYHNEGLRMDSHLGAIIETAEAIERGTFNYESLGLPPDRATEVRALLERVVRDHADDLRTYAYLHDLKKPDTMNVELADGTQRVFTMAEWETLLADAGGDEERARAMCSERGITKIGYRHTEELTGGEAKDHGPEGAAYVTSLAAADPEIAAFIADKQLILTGVAAHEMHFQVFPSTNAAKQYREQIAAQFSPEEVDFILTVNLLDIAGSKGPDGRSEYSGLRNMLEARAAYEAIEAFRKEREAAGRPLRENELGNLLNLKGVDAVARKIAELAKPPEATALAAEQLAAVEAKLPDWLRDLKVPEDQHEAVRAALQSDHYARALGALKLGKLTGVVKGFLARSASS
ncbi:hypothetical protein HY635_03845 [Candidatus Uhrbacteria bacterium]|nr:hypothetical protein [Candidatus Uhrbacteria bacterium]